MQALAGGDRAHVLQPEASDQDKTRRLLRLVSLLIMWPALSTGVVLGVWGGTDHYLHTGLFLFIGAGGVALWFAAPKLASRAASMNAS